MIVEYGFLDSTGDDVSQLKNNYEAYAGAVVKAVLEYIGYASTPEEGFYIVKSGDTLWSIAKTYGVNVNDIKQLNNLTSNLLSVGQQLKIPGMASNESEQTYVVKSGDSLYSIANRYNLSVNELKSYNNLTSNNLSIGQLLKIPMKEITEETITTDYITHIVVSGDTLYSLASKYNTTVSDIIESNNLTSTSLSIGQQLKIPTSEEIETESYTIYTVKSGDTLYSIARNYNVTVSDITNFNNLTSTSLSIGQQLRIPTSSITESEDYALYTVKSGDNLYSIARDYNTTVSNIMSLNNLKTNLLSIGQQLRIPI